MKQLTTKFALFALFLCATLAGGCLFDSGIPWKHAKYALIWIDDPRNVSLSYDAGEGSWIGRIEPSVFAVGSDERYVVAKQHPRGDKSITSYFIIEVAKDSLYAEPKDVVVGPLTEEDFKERSAQLRLPPCNKVLESLK